MNKKHQLPETHKISPQNRYTFTISPNSEHIQDQFEQCIGFLHKIQKYCYIDMRAELTDYARRLHYHGTIQFKDYQSIPYVYNIFHDYYAEMAIEIDTIKDYNWYLYCRKSRHITKFYVKNWKILYHITNQNTQRGNISIRDALLHGLE